MIQQTLFEECSADQIKTIFGQPDHRALQLDPAPPVQHMGQDNPAHFLRQTVCHQRVKERLGLRPTDLDFCKCADVLNADTLAHCFAFGFHQTEMRCAAEAVVIPLLDSVTRKPARALMAEHFLKNSTFGLQPLIKWRGFDRPSRQPVEMRKGDFMAQFVVLMCLDDLPILVSVISKPTRIVFAHIDVSRTMHHPARQFARQSRPPADADLRAATAPVIAHTRRRADQRVAIWRMADRAMHFARNPEFREYRHPIQRVFQPWHDPVVICIKQPVFVIPRALIMPDRVRVLFLIDPDQPLFLLHPDISRDQLVIPDHGKFAVQILEFRHIFGNEIMVRHGRHR